MAAATLMSAVGMGSSKEFLDLVKAIGECRSKAEEDRIVMNEIEVLKKKMSEPDHPPKKMKEYVIRLVYVEMLGHDASFGYIHAVKMTHHSNLLLKKTGYLATSLFLDDNHDLIILIVNTIQQDLRSDNHLVVCAALSAVCKLINSETIPAVLNQVAELLHHPKETVRKKAVMALHRFTQRSPSAVSHLIPRFRQVLCDKDPSVMAAALCALHELIVQDAAPYKNLTASFVSILKQVAEHRLPKNYDYHRTPAPFVQIKLLKILAVLGAADKSSSENMYSVLADVLRRADTGINIGNAILYECVCTITAIYPNTKLLGSGAEITARFLKSESHNLRYMGIDALGRIVKINPEYATEHQLAVIDCLEDRDDTLKRKTLDLLYKMTKPNNVEVIVERMVAYMKTVTDAHGKTEIANRVIELAERYAPNNQWFIQTMNSVFELAGDLVRPSVAHDLMRLIAEGNGEEDEDADSALRASAVESYLTLLEEPKLPSTLLQVICWVLGEYGTSDGAHTAEDIVARLCDVAERYSSDDTVRGYAVSAIQKLCAFKLAAGARPPLSGDARQFVDELTHSRSTDLQQRAYELQALLGLPPGTLAAVLPVDASCEDLEVDGDLSFLNGYVQQALSRGAKRYVPENERLGIAAPGSDLSSLATPLTSSHRPNTPPVQTLRFEAYQKPTPPSASPPPPPAASADLDTGYRSGGGSGGENSGGLRLEGVQRKWGRPTWTPASAAASSSGTPGPSTSQPSSTGGGTLTPPSTARNDPPLPPYRPKEPEVPEEKRRLAASLFGGGGSGVAKTTPPPRTAAVGKGAGAKKVVGGAGSERPMSPPQPKPATPQPEMNLLDFGSEPAPTPSAVSDPFKQLEGLSVSDTPANPTPVSQPPPAKPAFDLSSLYGAPLAAPAVPSVTQVQAGLPAGFSNRPTSPVIAGAGKGQGAPLKGEASSGPVQKSGVTPQGASPALFKDLLG